MGDDELLELQRDDEMLIYAFKKKFTPLINSINYVGYNHESGLLPSWCPLSLKVGRDQSYIIEDNNLLTFDILSVQRKHPIYCLRVEKSGSIYLYLSRGRTMHTHISSPNCFEIITESILKSVDLKLSDLNNCEVSK